MTADGPVFCAIMSQFVCTLLPFVAKTVLNISPISWGKTTPKGAQAQGHDHTRAASRHLSVPTGHSSEVSAASGSMSLVGRQFMGLVLRFW